MKLTMIGTKFCNKCKMMKPNIESYCDAHDIGFVYYNIDEAPKLFIDILTEASVKQAPVFIIYENGSPIVLSGDDIFIELDKL